MELNHISKGNDQSGLSDYEIRSLNFFWIGFLIYTLSFSIAITSYVNFIVCNAFQVIGLALLIPFSVNLIRFKFDSVYVSIVFIIMIGWFFFIIVRGFQLNYQFIKNLLVNPYEGIFLYFVPFMLLFPRNLLYYKRIFRVIVILGVFYIVYNLFFIKDLLYRGQNLSGQAISEYLTKTLSIPTGFLLLTFLYHSRKRRFLALFIIVITFLIAAIRARRALMFMSVNILILTYFISYYAYKGKTAIFFLSMILIPFIYFAGAKLYKNNQSGAFGLITQRIDEDTRTYVEVNLYRDMKATDWIIGKGINGKYFCPGINDGGGIISVYRSGIETDYLNIILKGGIISFGLILLIAIPAMFKGLFQSKNLLSKVSGFWILLWLTDLYPTVVTTFTLNYMLVWISIGICYSNTIRNMPESEIKEVFSN
jgi:hypothetical protein